MEPYPDHSATPEAVMQSVRLSEQLRQSITSLNEQLFLDADFEVNDDQLEALTQLIGEEYVYAHAVLTGEVYELDEETDEPNGELRVMLQEDASFHGFGVVQMNGRRSVLLCFLVPDESKENWQSYAARPDDITEFKAYPDTIFRERDQIDIFEDFVRETEGILLSKDFANYSQDKQFEIADVAIEAIDTSLRPVYGEKNLLIASDFFYRLDTTANDGWWKNACVDQRQPEVTERKDIYGRYVGVTIPSMHPACRDMYVKKDDKEIYNSPCLVIDSNDMDPGHIVLAPLKYVNYIDSDGYGE